MARGSNIDEFICKAVKLYGKTFLNDKVDYGGCFSEIEIGCRVHGYFKTTPMRHLSGIGCLQCNKDERKNRQNGHKPDTTKFRNEIFIYRCNRIFGNKYLYAKTKYNTQKHEITVTCKKHGDFIVNAKRHLDGSGCALCGDAITEEAGISSGEAVISLLLEKMGIQFDTQKTFSGCRDKNPLRFDFYLPKYNLLIEYDGEQHFKPIKIWGGEKAFKGVRRRDAIKNKYAADNGIDLLRIPYTKKDFINGIIKRKIKSITPVKVGQLELF